jgi:transposase InsO family protein
MSHKGNCYENAPVERFFGSLKNELVQHRGFHHHTAARYAIVEFIERGYNRQRLHQALGIAVRRSSSDRRVMPISRVCYFGGTSR